MGGEAKTSWGVSHKSVCAEWGGLEVGKAEKGEDLRGNVGECEGVAIPTAHNESLFLLFFWN